MEGVLHAMRGEALRLRRLYADPRIGIVTSYDPNTHRARVQYMPSQVLDGAIAESGWMPIATAAVGAGWGVYAAPVPGEQVFIVHQEHAMGGGIIIGRVNSLDAPPPSVPGGEIWLVHQTGTAIKLFNTGECHFLHHSGSFIKLVEDGTIQCKGDMHVDGEVFDKHGSLDRLRQNYDQHKHGQVQSGGSFTGITDHVDPE